jgi:hypothetical protein
MSTYSEAYDEGHAAYSVDEPLIANPYLPGTFKALAWVYGWLDAQTEDREPKLPIL